VAVVKAERVRARHKEGKADIFEREFAAAGESSAEKNSRDRRSKIAEE
jgi:hypothetical protein